MSSSSSSAEAANPEPRKVDLSALCSTGMRPQVMAGFLIQHLRTHFATANNIETPGLRDYLWAPENAGKLVIESVTRWKPELTEKRPAIVVKRGPWQIARRGINDQHLGNTPLDGHDRHSVFMRGSHTLFCIAGEGAETEQLATEVYRELNGFAPIIRQWLNLHRFVLAHVGELSLLKEATDNFVVPVSVAYVFEESTTLRSDAPALKRIQISVRDLAP